MTPHRTWRALFLAFPLVLASCSGEGTSPTSSAPNQTTTTTVEPTTTISEGRPLRIVGCNPAEEEVEILCEAYDLIQRHYVDQVGDEALAAAAERGLAQLDGATNRGELVCAVPSPEFHEACALAAEEAEDGAEAAEAMVSGLATYALDPNSVYLDPEALALVQEEQEGQIEGIGALVTAEDTSSGQPVQCSVISETCRMFIVSTFAGSPAEEADLRRDDVIVAVDGMDIDGWTLDEVTAVVRGPAGTEVRLTVERGSRVFEVAIVRDEVVVPVVVSEMVDGTGYAALTLFTENADEQLAEELAALVANGAEALVFDLRDNPGGLLDTSIEVASMFLPAGEVVITEGPGSETEYQVTGDLVVPPDVEVIVLVNRGSASASEVVAAVLQERMRAVVVGENTFGKNTVQQRYGLSNGGAIKLTVARWVTPGGLDFGQTGITPDVAHEFTAGASLETVVGEALAAAAAAG